MKYLENIKEIAGKQIGKNGSFSFDCRKDLACFNQCCHNLNLFLYPYDIIRLKKRLEMSSERFLDKYVDVVLREHNYFPDTLLKMRENSSKACPFLSSSGCTVYTDRPGTCRWFPIEPGMYYDSHSKETHDIYFFRPPDFCLGRKEDHIRTIPSWSKSQNTKSYHAMAVEWAELKRLFQSNPWSDEGPNGPKGKMAFMAVYNIDDFRTFIFQSSFLKRYKVPQTILKKIRSSDTELLRLAFDWIKYYLWGMASKKMMRR